MVFSGRPSPGCESCRKAKKRCDQGLPSCGRCVRLGKTCEGYRDVGELLFRDESRRFVGQDDDIERGSAGTTGLPDATGEARSASGTTTRDIFFDLFVVEGHLQCLKDRPLDDLLAQAATACTLIVRANRGHADDTERNAARTCYVEAMTAIHVALRDSTLANRDSAIVAVYLLNLYEQLDWLPGRSGRTASQHIQGLSSLLDIYGAGLTVTPMGLELFRDIRSALIADALTKEVDVPVCVVDGTAVLPMLDLTDKLALIASSTASLRRAFCVRDVDDLDLLRLAESTEQDLQDWQQEALQPDSDCDFRTIRHTASGPIWEATRHVYWNFRTSRDWNIWRCLYILVSRISEGIWRRSWPMLIGSGEGKMPPEHYNRIRIRLAEQVYISAASLLCTGQIDSKPSGFVAYGLILVKPLAVAATCLLEVLAQVVSTTGGSRAIVLDRAYHLHEGDNNEAALLAKIIELVDYVASDVGIRSAGALSRLLKGQAAVLWDIERTRVMGDSS